MGRQSLWPRDGGAQAQQSRLSRTLPITDACSLSILNVPPYRPPIKTQVRQKAEHKRTFFMLEQLILKHEASENAILIKVT